MAFRFDPRDPAFVRDPYSTYKEMRDRHPAYRTEETGFWLITRYEDVSRALADPATFSSSRGNSTVDTPVRVGKTLGTIDPPRHDELRRIVLKGFTPARIEAVQPGVREHTKRQVAEHPGARRPTPDNDNPGAGVRHARERGKDRCGPFPSS